MSIEGRINVDVLFHDKDGTASLKVVSLQDSFAASSGKVAVVSGTCGTAAVTIQVAPSSYRDASGSLVSFSAITKTIVEAGANPLIITNPSIIVSAGSVAVVPAEIADFDDSGQLPTVASASDTSSYTMIFYGT